MKPVFTEHVSTKGVYPTVCEFKVTLKTGGCGEPGSAVRKEGILRIETKHLEKRFYL